MTVSDSALTPDRTDYGLAALIGLVALGAYIRTLAPDVLYGDSAEFQTLAYSLGTTHCTGYPVYLLLARLVGFLPMQSPAWRVNLVSALCAAGTVGGLYLLIRFLTPSRVAAALGSIGLAQTYALWSQAIIAEVYTPATALLVTVLVLLAWWQQDPYPRRRALGWAAALTCLGLGVHASAVLVGPTALLFALWVIAAQPRQERWPCLRSAALGFGIGIGLYFLAFAALDLNNPPSSFMQTTMVPSRSVWGLEVADLDSVFDRWWVTISGVQWQPAMFPEGADLAGSLASYYSRVLGPEFSVWMLFLALVGLGALSWASGSTRETNAPVPEAWPQRVVGASAGVRLRAFLLATYVVMLVFILNYHPSDIHIFYLPTYLFVAAALAMGIGRLLEWAQRPWTRARVKTRVGTRARHRWARALYPPVLVACALVVIAPHADSRWQALKAGVGTFVEDTYPYPRDNLKEPRQIATLRLYTLPEDAFLIMEWRPLYTMLYLAHIEGVRPNIIIKEATPFGSDSRNADTLLEEMTAAMDAGRPVLTDSIYPGLRDRFRVMPAAGGRYYRLTPLTTQGTP